MSIRIRHIDGDEWSEELLTLQKDCLPLDEPLDPASGDWWLAFDQDAPIAFACLKPSASVANAGYLARAGVLPTHRGLGLQKRLIRVRIRRAKKYGWEWLRTDTRANAPSGNNILACGFQLFDPDAPWAHVDAIYYRRKLAA